MSGSNMTIVVVAFVLITSAAEGIIVYIQRLLGSYADS